MAPRSAMKRPAAASSEAKPQQKNQKPKANAKTTTASQKKVATDAKSKSPEAPGRKRRISIDAKAKSPEPRRGRRRKAAVEEVTETHEVAEAPTHKSRGVKGVEASAAVQGRTVVDEVALVFERQTERSLKREDEIRKVYDEREQSLRERYEAQLNAVRERLAAEAERRAHAEGRLEVFQQAQCAIQCDSEAPPPQLCDVSAGCKPSKCPDEVFSPAPKKARRYGRQARIAEDFVIVGDNGPGPATRELRRGKSAQDPDPRPAPKAYQPAAPGQTVSTHFHATSLDDARRLAHPGSSSSTSAKTAGKSPGGLWGLKSVEEVGYATSR